MKGIILAGGLGSRLYPITHVVCKQLLPIFDKPMIFYPLSVLLLSGIRDILIITTPQDMSRFESLLGDGAHLGISLSYKSQESPNGIADAFRIGESFIGKDSVALILGDNIFYGNGFSSILQRCRHHNTGAIIFGYEMEDPRRYGILEFDSSGQIIDILEKPEVPPSSIAVTGLYYYDNTVISLAKSLLPSARGELEITDINRIYMREKKLQWILLDRGFAWLDTGTPVALAQASNYVQTIQERQGIKIACLEEISYEMGYITLDQLSNLTGSYGNTEYGKYLLNILYRERTPLLSSV
ncbi:MAG: glucose-1-phosphate thymidylyltransferase RfbA [Chlamydiales bacterium]